MKTKNQTKKALILCFFIISAMAFANPSGPGPNGRAHALRIDPVKKEKPAKACLIIKGKFLKSTKGVINTYTMSLIRENTVVEAKTVECGSSFQFKIGKGNWWAIKITGEGCIPKIYSINTNLPENADTDMIYSLTFSASEPISEFESSLMDSEALDFPIAIFQFDQKLDAFNYNEEYTDNIMNKLLEKIKTSDN